MKVKITKPVVGKYRLGYAVGDTADLPANIAKQLVEDGYAELVEEPKRSRSRRKKTVEK